MNCASATGEEMGRLFSRKATILSRLLMNPLMRSVYLGSGVTFMIRSMALRTPRHLCRDELAMRMTSFTSRILAALFDAVPAATDSLARRVLPAAAGGGTIRDGFSGIGLKATSISVSPLEEPGGVRGREGGGGIKARASDRGVRDSSDCAGGTMIDSDAAAGRGGRGDMVEWWCHAKKGHGGTTCSRVSRHTANKKSCGHAGANAGCSAGRRERGRERGGVCV